MTLLLKYLKREILKKFVEKSFWPRFYYQKAYESYRI